MTKQSVTGLTTAASLWGVVRLGIASGMGYDALALTITSFIGVFIVVTLVQKVSHLSTTKKVESS